MKTRVAVRVYCDATLESETLLELDPDSLDSEIERLATAHAERSLSEPIMVEFEFLDVPSEERFFRIGSDPRGMVLPSVLDVDVTQ